MFGLGKPSDLKAAAEQLNTECGIKLNILPDKRSVVELFASMGTGLSREAQVALFYRLVAMNFLGACKLMRDGGRNTPAEKLLWVSALVDKSGEWSQRAHDRVALEAITSQLNENIQNFMSSFGVRHGAIGG
ncbi:MAG: hypothetical protein ACREBW_04350 [Candidatus Micrarchaeaceae archaeon]